jgi:hypothetical protein
MMADWVSRREQSQTASRQLMGSACVVVLRSLQRHVGRTAIGDRSDRRKRTDRIRGGRRSPQQRIVTTATCCRKIWFGRDVDTH